MARMNDTRQRVLETAATLFQRQGYGATGLTQVLSESRAPKGSLYFHFPEGKEQLAVEAIALSGHRLGADLRAALTTAPDLRTAIIRMGDLLADNLEGSQFHEGCPVATVALEAATGSDAIRDTCRAVYTAWLDGLTRYLLSQSVPAEEAGPLSELILSALQGALLIARVKRDVTGVRTVGAQVADVAARAAADPHTPTSKD